jgi:hypothetical protein
MRPRGRSVVARELAVLPRTQRSRVFDREDAGRKIIRGGH